jgi:hypothetical protein
MGQVGVCTEGLIWLVLHWGQDYVYIVTLYLLIYFIKSCYLLVEGHRVLVVSLHYSLDTL